MKNISRGLYFFAAILFGIVTVLNFFSGNITMAFVYLCLTIVFLSLGVVNPGKQGK